jgi:hypothetical protein
MYTHLHGFIPVTKNDNIFFWIGFSKKEFINNIKEMGKKNKLKKFDGDIIYEINCYFSQYKDIEELKIYKSN